MLNNAYFMGYNKKKPYFMGFNESASCTLFGGKK